MAKKSTRAAVDHDREDWEAHDAMHTLMRADEIRKDEKLKAKQHASKMRDVAQQAESLAHRGLISDKAMSKMKGANVKSLDKTKPIASGKEGDGAGESENRGVSYR